MMKEQYFHFQDVAGTEQRLVDKVEIIQNSNGDLNFIYYLWAFGVVSLLVTIFGMLPYFGKLAQAPPTKKRKYYLIISNLSSIFSLTGFLSLLYGDRYISFAIQKCYEAIALNALRKLMLGYLGTEETFYRYSNEQGKQNYWRVPPCCCFIPPCLLPDTEFSQKQAKLLQLYTRQFILCAPILSLLMLFLTHGYPNIVGKTDDVEQQISLVIQICGAIITISTLFALYSVFVGWKLTRKLTQFNITKKFLLFKVFILLALVQEYFLEFLVEQGVLKVGNALYPSSQMIIVCLGFILCIEGPLIMMFINFTDAFSPKDLIPSKELKFQVLRREDSNSFDLEEKEEDKRINYDEEQQGNLYAKIVN